MKTIVTLIMTAFGMAAISQASVILTLDPGGAISGAAAGTTTGWGFTLSSDTDFAVITSSNFCIGGTGVTDPCAESTLGTYSDYIAANFTIAGPSPESPIVSQTFNATVFSGLGSFLIRGGEANGANDTGQVVVTYDL